MESTSNILEFLRGSKLVKHNDGLDGSLRQDRYSIRTAPQWLGPALEDLQLANQQITIECNSATDNPLIDQHGNSLHGGNFQAKAVTSAMEKTRQTIQNVGRMLFTQCTEMINPATSRGLPPNLVLEDVNKSGIFKGTDIQIAALISELGFLSNPVNHVESAEMGNQALNSLALISARYTHTAVHVLTEMAAAILLALCQALDLRAFFQLFLEGYRPIFVAVLDDLLQVCPLKPDSKSNHDIVKGLDASLWPKLVISLETTTHMDTAHRFSYIAQSLRSPLFDHTYLGYFSDPMGALESFTKALQPSMERFWLTKRDEYELSGDASPFLGKASKALYQFVRQDLGIPFLTTTKIATPKFEGSNPLETEDAMRRQPSSQAPTVGSYQSILYRALRDGSASAVVLKLMELNHPRHG